MYPSYNKDLNSATKFTAVEQPDGLAVGVILSLNNQTDYFSQNMGSKEIYLLYESLCYLNICNTAGDQL